MRGIRRTFKFVSLFLIIVVFATFAISNRATTEVSFTPLPYSMEMPLFLLILGCFSLGIFSAWIALMGSVMKARIKSSKEHKKVMALENELKGIKLEQDSVIPALSGDLGKNGTPARMALDPRIKRG
jgi:uncharacterized integral membrane protein